MQNIYETRKMVLIADVRLQTRTDGQLVLQFRPATPVADASGSICGFAVGEDWVDAQHDPSEQESPAIQVVRVPTKEEREAFLRRFTGQTATWQRLGAKHAIDYFFGPVRCHDARD